ncbi:MAG TPA: siderophore biosynthesis PLP-dependent protein, partial [Psychrobacter sp.]|nr:siderophore biosynthesis PLP-dependent protein [Psychrobacter sp.]
MMTDATTNHSIETLDKHPLPPKIIDCIQEFGAQQSPICAYIYDLNA